MYQVTKGNAGCGVLNGIIRGARFPHVGLYCVLIAFCEVYTSFQGKPLGPFCTKHLDQYLAYGRWSIITY